MKVTKYLLTTFLALVLVLALAACGNNEPEPEPTPEPTPIATPEPTPEPEPEPEPDVEEDDDIEETGDLDPAAYVAAMEEFIVAFEGLMEALGMLVGELSFIETDEEMLDWVDAFELVMHAVFVSEEELMALTPYAPEDYLDAHILITAAVSLISDSLEDLDDALVAGIMGDDAAMNAGVDSFLINLLAADILWNEAIYGPNAGTLDAALLGTWGWDEYPAWAYTFEIDGTGQRIIGDLTETFVWETIGNVELLLDRGENTPAGEVRIEHWSYVIVGDILTITSMQVADVVLNYIRQ